MLICADNMLHSSQIQVGLYRLLKEYVSICQQDEKNKLQEN